jgi:TPR repeat protein
MSTHRYESLVLFARTASRNPRMLGLILLLAGCNRAGVDAAQGADCSDGDSCEKQARALARKVEQERKSNDRSAQEKSAAQATTAVALFQRGCDLGNGSSCEVLGMYLDTGGLTPPDLPRAVRLSERACALKQFTSCDRLAFFYRMGHGVPKDPALQAKYRKLACDFAPPMGKDTFCKHDNVDDALRNDCSDGEACFRQARLLAGTFFDAQKGMEKLTSEKAAACAAKAVALYQKGCDLGDGESCAALGEELRLGGLTPIDLPRAARIFEKACGLKDIGGCDELSKFYRDGEGVPKNRALQAKYRKLACDYADRLEKETFCKDK